MNRFLTLSFGASLLLQLIPACAADEVFPEVHNQPIAVRVADGNSGKPLPNQHVLLIAGYNRRDLDLAQWHEEAVTDGEGQVRLSNTLRNLPLLRVEVLQRHSCEPGSDQSAFSMERIRLEGLSGVDRCGTIRVEEALGVLTVFVKGKKGDVFGVTVLPPLVAAAPASAPAAATAPVSVVASSAPMTAAPVSSSRPEAGRDGGRAAEPPAEAALPPIPFALPADFFSAADRLPDSAAESVSVPSAPRVVTHRSAAKPRPVTAASGSKSGPVAEPSSKPAPAATAAKPASREAAHPGAALRHAVALERGRKRAVNSDARDSSPATGAAAPATEKPHVPDHLISHAKPSAGHVLAPESWRISASPIAPADAQAAHSASAPSQAPAPVRVPAPAPPLHSISSPAPTPSSADMLDEGGVDPLCAPEAGQS